MLDLAAVSEQSVIGCFNAAANSRLRKAPAPDSSRAVATPVPDVLRAVYAARTFHADALAVRAANTSTTYFAAGQRTRTSYGYIATRTWPPAPDGPHSSVVDQKVTAIAH